MIIKHKTSLAQLAKIRKGDIVLIEFERKDKPPQVMKAEIIDIAQDERRCAGCSIRLHDKKIYQYKRQEFCFDCFNRRREKEIELRQVVAKKRGKTKAFWKQFEEERW